ncbi:hypothetical protein ACFHW2_16215 [Actinomadura sp. LOL_016]|uniref:hypothetical protein n=1 Tax=unclassified Actinomadura TaxID=2626254 RepID=UPI003A7FB836
MRSRQSNAGLVVEKVEDVEAAPAEYSALPGHRWTVEIGGPAPVRTPSGETVLTSQAGLERCPGESR